MEIIKIIGIAFITVICSTLIKSSRPELSFAVTTAGVLLIVLQIFSSITEISTIFFEITQISGVDNNLVKLILKLVGIGYLTELSAGILTDFGSPSLADKVVLGGKMTIIILSFPVIKGLLSIMENFVKLI